MTKYLKSRSSIGITQRTCIIILLLGAMTCGCGRVDAKGAEPYITATELDLRRFLPTPPAADSQASVSEIAEVLAIQNARTIDQAEQARSYSVEGIVSFWTALGVALPVSISAKSQAFFDRLVATEAAVVDAVKPYYGRPRPHMVDKRIVPIVKLVTSSGWPSGHAANGWLFAIILAEMIPERREGLFKRADEFAESRIIGGIHRRSDLIAGRQAGSLIALALLNRPDFHRDLESVRSELRRKLDLPD